MSGHQDLCSRRLRQLEMPGEFICGRRRQVRVGSCRVPGYSVPASGLGPEQSLRLQRAGLAAGQRFGWGVFVPYKQ